MLLARALCATAPLPPVCEQTDSPSCKIDFVSPALLSRQPRQSSANDCSCVNSAYPSLLAGFHDRIGCKQRRIHHCRRARVRDYPACKKYSAGRSQERVAHTNPRLPGIPEPGPVRWRRRPRDYSLPNQHGHAQPKHVHTVGMNRWAQLQLLCNSKPFSETIASLRSYNPPLFPPPHHSCSLPYALLSFANLVPTCSFRNGCVPVTVCLKPFGSRRHNNVHIL